MIQKITRILTGTKNSDPPKHPHLGFANPSYSQEGEDLVLNRYFNAKDKGFYIDIGAHHPFRFSNTMLFYEKGWTGINIDPLPGIKELFDKFRPHDINIESAIGLKQELLTYYTFNEPALNTFDKVLLEQYIKAGYKHTGSIEVKIKPLSDLLPEIMPPNLTIDFMSIDVEGMEMEVLRSNNWDKFRPVILVIEILDFQLDHEHPIVEYLKELNYKIIAKTFNSVFFKSQL